MGASVFATKAGCASAESSSEDALVIDGRVEGSITYQSRQVTIRKSGRVKADVHARIIVVEGTIEGDLRGDEAVHMRRTARVVGNVTSPRIILDDGATVRGHIRTSRRSPSTTPRSSTAEQAPSTEMGGTALRSRHPPSRL